MKLIACGLLKSLFLVLVFFSSEVSARNKNSKVDHVDSDQRPPVLVNHHHVKLGDSFLYSVKVNAAGKEPKTYMPRFDGIDYNNSGGVIFSVDQGPKKADQQSDRVITRTVYAIEQNKCATDMLTGVSMFDGEDCATDKPMREVWTYGQGDDMTACKLNRPFNEQLNVNDSELETVSIRCESNSKSRGLRGTSDYWYAPQLGVMVKSKKVITDQGENVLKTEEAELISFQQK